MFQCTKIFIYNDHVLYFFRSKNCVLWFKDTWERSAFCQHCFVLYLLNVFVLLQSLYLLLHTVIIVIILSLSHVVTWFLIKHDPIWLLSILKVFNGKTSLKGWPFLCPIIQNKYITLRVRLGLKIINFYGTAWHTATTILLFILIQFQYLHSEN